MIEQYSRIYYVAVLLSLL